MEDNSTRSGIISKRHFIYWMKQAMAEDVRHCCDCDPYSCPQFAKSGDCGEH